MGILLWMNPLSKNSFQLRVSSRMFSWEFGGKQQDRQGRFGIHETKLIVLLVNLVGYSAQNNPWSLLRESEWSPNQVPLKKRRKDGTFTLLCVVWAPSGYREGGHFVGQTKFGCHNTFWGTWPPPPMDGHIWEVGWMSQHLLENMTPPLTDKRHGGGLCCTAVALALLLVAQSNIILEPPRHNVEPAEPRFGPILLRASVKGSEVKSNRLASTQPGLPPIREFKGKSDNFFQSRKSGGFQLQFGTKFKSGEKIFL